MEGNNSYGHGSSWADQWDTSDPAAPTTVSNKKKAAAVAQPRSTSRSLRCLMMAAIIMDAIAMAMPIPIRCSSDGGLGSPFVSLVYKGTVSLSYNKMNTDVLMMSNVNILAGGIWKFETVVSMVSNSLEVSILKSLTQEQGKCYHCTSSTYPEPQDPVPKVLNICQYSLGNQGSQVYGHIKVVVK
ncbi:hypothetical protein V6N13_107567 [Hibiscus sabdariffa]